MSSPVVSVLMPVHNGAAYLRPAVESILAQTFTDFEFIIVDDNSSDETAAIIRSFSDPRIRLLQASERLRICRALNLGLDYATGRFVARMDADDLSRPRRLERQVAYLTRHPEVGLCGTWVSRFGAGLRPRVDRRPPAFEGIRAYSLFDNPLIHSTVMLRRGLLRETGLRYDDAFRNAEDYDLWTRLFDRCRAGNLPDVLLDYRVHAGSVTQEASAGMDQAACRVTRRLLEPFAGELAAEDVFFHRCLGTGRLYPETTEASLRRAETWLTRLIVRNDELALYDGGALRAVAAEVWFGLCYRALPLGWNAVRASLRSDLIRPRAASRAVLLLAYLKRALPQGGDPARRA